MAAKLSLVLLSLQLRLCQSADTELMKSTIETYFSKSRHHKTNRQYKIEARVFIYGEFKRFGLDTEFQVFFGHRNQPKVTFANIIGVLKGERFGQADDKILGVAAHYDTMPDTPGVDDNGAGVAAMLEVLRQVTEANKQGLKRKNTIIFISFDAEELDYIGGVALMKHWKSKFFKKHYGEDAASKLVPYGVIVMDTMMNYNTTRKSQKIPKQYMQVFQNVFPEATYSIAKDDFEGDFLLLMYRKPTNDKILATSFLTAWNKVGRPEFEIESFPLPYEDTDELERQKAFGNFVRSDHVALWSGDIPAILISDSANFRGKMVNCYHKSCDNLQMLTEDNLKFLGKTADAITSTLNTLSMDPPSTSSASHHRAYLFLFILWLV